MLVFLFILFFFIFIIIFTTIKIKIECKNKSYKIVFYLALFNKIKYLKIVFSKEKIIKFFEKVKKRKKINIYKIEKDYMKNKNNIKLYINKLKMNFEYIDLKLEIGTDFILLTSIIITTLSIIFPMFIHKYINKYKKEKYNYKFLPIYNKNEFNLELNCIICIKMVHIINVILKILLKKGDIKNVRTSNTRFNDNCYE